MASSVAKQRRQEGLRKNEQKWSPLLMDAGWMVVPNVIIEHQKVLGLDAVDINILLHLIRHWWQPDNLPHPSKRLIAECLGVDLSTVRRHIARMEQRNLIKRVPRFDKTHGQKTNCYELSGLIEAAKPLAQEALKIRKQRREEDAVRRTRSRPRIFK
jgi:predicted transcriptional regulator